MKLLFVSAIVLFCQAVQSQKPPIDLDALRNWDYDFTPGLTNDGKFIFIDHRKGNRSNLTIRSSDLKWKKTLNNTSEPEFSNNSQWLVCRGSNDSLLLLQLGSSNIIEIARVSTYKLSKGAESCWLAYQKKNTDLLVLKNPASPKEYGFPFVTSYYFDPSGRTLFLYMREDTGRHSKILKRITLDDLSELNIWKGDRDEELVNLSFSKDGSALAFFVRQELSSGIDNSLWFYESSFPAAWQRLADVQLTLSHNVIMNPVVPPAISSDGEKVFFYVHPQTHKQNATETQTMQVWSYLDPFLVTEQPPYEQSSFMVLHTHSNKIFPVTTEKEILPQLHADNKFSLVQHCAGSFSESNWNRFAAFSYSLVNTEDGSRIALKDGIHNETFALQLSPTGKWVTYFDITENDYFTFQTVNGTWRNVTKTIDAAWLNTDNDKPAPELAYLGQRTPCWLSQDARMLVPDNFDIWLIDPANEKKALNITREFGKKNKIKFQLIQSPAELGKLSAKKDSLLVTGFNVATKELGIYSVALNGSRIPRRLITGAFSLGSVYAPAIYKAADAHVYVIRHMSATEAPNLFLTTDFITLTPLTDEQPQQQYNWLTAELMNWKTADSFPLQGIVYKPENFDATKKYPVIITFYERVSDGLHEYLVPGLTQSGLNIPWFVSRGYIVFTPDIRYTIGKPGNSALQCILSGLKELTRQPWIDAGKIGLYGHSWGGFQVNYLLTKTNIFAAGVDAAGSTDFVSAYGLTSHGNKTRTWLYEQYQSRMGTTLWERPDFYINNSPIFEADRITTPLLIMHNKKDHQVPWTEGLQWFNALRRSGKRAWMLQYENGGHGVVGEDAIDYTQRLLQFFDHYLKGKPAPLWMTRSSVAERLDAVGGLKPDNNINTPVKGGVLQAKEMEKFKSLK